MPERLEKAIVDNKRKVVADNRDNLNKVSNKRENNTEPLILAKKDNNQRKDKISVQLANLIVRMWNLNNCLEEESNKKEEFKQLISAPRNLILNSIKPKKLVNKIANLGNLKNAKWDLPIWVKRNKLDAIIVEDPPSLKRDKIKIEDL